MIDDVRITPLRQISDERGSVMHMLREDAPHFERFGEVYFSWVYPGAIKAWHMHREMTLNYAVPVGRIKVVLFDDREGSATRGVVWEHILDEGHYELLTIPPMLWSGFRCVGPHSAMVANCATLPHRADEIERKDAFTTDIPYQWRTRPT